MSACVAVLCGRLCSASQRRTGIRRGDAKRGRVCVCVCAGVRVSHHRGTVKAKKGKVRTTKKRDKTGKEICGGHRKWTNYLYFLLMRQRRFKASWQRERCVPVVWCGLGVVFLVGLQSLCNEEGEWGERMRLWQCVRRRFTKEKKHIDIEREKQEWDKKKVSNKKGGGCGNKENKPNIKRSAKKRRATRRIFHLEHSWHTHVPHVSKECEQIPPSPPSRLFVTRRREEGVCWGGGCLAT